MGSKVQPFKSGDMIDGVLFFIEAVKAPILKRGMGGEPVYYTPVNPCIACTFKGRVFTRALLHRHLTPFKKEVTEALRFPGVHVIHFLPRASPGILALWKQLKHDPGDVV